MGFLSRRRKADRPEVPSDGGTGRFQALVENASDIITVFGPDGRLQHQSPSVEQVLGYRADEFITDPWFLVHPGDLARVTRYVAEALTNPGIHSAIEIRMRHRDGRWRYLEAVATTMRDETEVSGLVVTSRDITDRKVVEDALARQAFYDPVTNLANRNLFAGRLGQALMAGERGRSGVAVLFLDLDGFKLVNDSLGHAAGDWLLTTAAQRLTGCVRPGDLVARFGGDEFTVLLERIAYPETAIRIAEQIVKEFRRPFVLDDRQVFVGASVGIAMRGPDAPRVRADDLIREADTALYAAKAAGKGRAVVFTPDMNERVTGRLALETDLHGVIERDELRLLYQPTIDLTTGAISGVEALVRWAHPRRGLVSPTDFIPLAEETGLVVPIGEWVLQEAVRQAQAWQSLRAAAPPLTMSVNLSARQIQQPDLVDRVQHVLRAYEMNPSHLKLEITESTLVKEEAAARQTLHQLRGLGVQVALDDFGTGYSSLSYLRSFKADTLKIDRSFIAAIESGGDAIAIVGAIASLAHALGMDVTVEGVETAEQLLRVRSVRCDQGQGFYFSEPVTGDTIGDLLRRGTGFVGWAA